MNFIQHRWKIFCNYIIDNRKTIIVNYLIFLVSIAILLIIDLVCKHTLFDSNNLGSIKHKNWLFGIRSVKNEGLTFLPFLKANDILLTFFNFVIITFCIILIIFLKSHWFAIFIGFIFSGALGNTIDRLAFGYVRDIIYLPWADNGTFNFADTDVIIGCIGTIITMLTIYIRRKD